MVKIKKNRFFIENKKIVIQTGLQIRLLVILFFSFCFLSSFFVLSDLSVSLIDSFLLFKGYYIYLLAFFILCWYLSDIKIIFNANSKTVIKKIWFIKKYIIHFKSIEDVQLISHDNISYYGIVLKEDPLGKRKIISPKYSKTEFDKKQLKEFDERVFIKLKSFINTKTI